MPTAIKILMVEDSQNDADLLMIALRRAGFAPEWKRVQTESDFLAEIKNSPDIILSDYSMPSFTGLQAAKLLQANGLDIPFILISGTMGEDAAVEAMKNGATDYLLKDRIARLGSAVQRALDEKRRRDEHRQAAEEKRKNEERFLQSVEAQLAILSALPAHIALIDHSGVIVTVNESWQHFATTNVLQGPSFGVGQNYLEICESAQGECAEEAQAAAAGIRRVLRCEAKEFAIEYHCHSPTEQCWFRLIATPLRESQTAGAVVMHVNITERKRAEEEIQSQLKELQRWQEAMLGREGRVLELKHEVNELLTRHNLPERYSIPISS